MSRLPIFFQPARRPSAPITIIQKDITPERQSDGGVLWFVSIWNGTIPNVGLTCGSAIGRCFSAHTDARQYANSYIQDTPELWASGD